MGPLAIEIAPGAEPRAYNLQLTTFIVFSLDTLSIRLRFLNRCAALTSKAIKYRHYSLGYLQYQPLISNRFVLLQFSKSNYLQKIAENRSRRPHRDRMFIKTNADVYQWYPTKHASLTLLCFFVFFVSFFAIDFK